jgi:hypothetical protein
MWPPALAIFEQFDKASIADFCALRKDRRNKKISCQWQETVGQKSGDANVDGTHLFVVLGIGLYFVVDLLAFFQLLEAFTLNGGKMDEYIATAIIVGDEAVAFFGIEPLDSTAEHVGYLLH